MSGDVQPRKRKDKKRKKDELGVEEPRGTAAALGEGDVFMHSHHEHGTGGHWCAKIIFFSLLAVLITLIGLIILENRGLSELEANSVESRYSGVLEGWLEDAPDDDHHDEHTLELKHHDDDDHSPELNHDDGDDEHSVDEHDDDDQLEDHPDEDEEDSQENDADQENDDEDDQDKEDDDDDQDKDDDDDDQDDEDDDQGPEGEEADNDSEEPNLEEDDEQDDVGYETYDDSKEQDDKNDENDDNDNDLQEVDGDDRAEAENDFDNEIDEQSIENDDNGDLDDANVENNQNDSQEDKDEEEHEEEEEDVEEPGIEVEKLEKEITDEDALTDEHDSDEPEADNDDDHDDDDKSDEEADEDTPDDDDDAPEDEEFLEVDDIEEDLPVVEHIVAPKGKPLNEVEEETTVKPTDTLAEEEEYERQQEELKKEQEQASHMWLKLVVGGALLVATHAVVRRATAPRDDTPASEEHASREETPSLIDRRMTLITPESAPVAAKQLIEEDEPTIEEKIVEKVTSIVKSAPPPKDESEEELEEEDEEIIVQVKAPEPTKSRVEQKELYSDEEEVIEEEEIEEEEEEEIEEEIKETPKQSPPSAPAIEVEPEPDDEVPDDVEIIDDEQLEEELLEEEEEDEEEISDVDDVELLNRLEAKYGRLPEPERPGPKSKDGGNSIEDDWPGEPADHYWRQQLDQAEQELRQGGWKAASERLSAEALRTSVRAKWLVATSIDAEAEARRDNRILSRAISAYLEVLKMHERLSDVKLRQVTDRILDRIRFRGNYLSAEPVYRLLIRRFPDVVDYRNNLTVSFLMANRADLAEEVIKETLKKWPDDRLSLAHLGFVLKTQHNKLEEAIDAFQGALKGDFGPATEPRFYYHLGDALLLLGRFQEAHEVHKRGAALGHFLSAAQRSLYNVQRLKSQPWWSIENTPYIKLARALEKSWKDILKEGEAARALYEKEKEGLKERGEWSQLDLFVRGQEIPDRCKKAPVTCSIVRSEVAAYGCRRGQIKFSSMAAGTHVRPHVGPTNCRLRMHLGLSNTKDTYLRVDQEIRQWEVGKVLMFDDSFEHEVWHNGTGSRLVLIVDVWHPDLTAHERRTLPAI